MAYYVYHPCENLLMLACQGDGCPFVLPVYLEHGNEFDEQTHTLRDPVDCHYCHKQYRITKGEIVHV